MSAMKNYFYDEMVKISKETGYDEVYLMEKFNEQLDTNHGLDLEVFKTRALARDL